MREELRRRLKSAAASPSRALSLPLPGDLPGVERSAPPAHSAAGPFQRALAKGHRCDRRCRARSSPSRKAAPESAVKPWAPTGASPPAFAFLRLRRITGLFFFSASKRTSPAFLSAKTPRFSHIAFRCLAAQNASRETPLQERSRTPAFLPGLHRGFPCPAARLARAFCGRLRRCFACTAAGLCFPLCP